MQAVHPTATADGKLIETSRYIKKSDRAERFIYCGQCGFPVDLSKRATGPSLGAIGAPTAKTGSVTASQIGNIANPPVPPYRALAVFSDSYADPVDTKSGCPLCNSLNPKTVGRDSSPWTNNTVNLENL